MPGGDIANLSDGRDCYNGLARDSFLRFSYVGQLPTRGLHEFHMIGSRSYLKELSHLPGSISPIFLAEEIGMLP